MEYAIYIRVSTQKQGASGLGLEAQKEMCERYIASQGGVCSKVFKDVQSGTKRNRKGLWDAIDYCKKNGARLVIAKLDRLARDVEFTFKVINTGIDIHFVDMPVVNTMILGVFAAVAQYERELISSRTKSALEAKKKQGFKLGNGGKTIATAQKASGEARSERAKENPHNILFTKLLHTYTSGADIIDKSNCSKFVQLLNDWEAKTSSGLPFTEVRCYAMYNSLKKQGII